MLHVLIVLLFTDILGNAYLSMFFTCGQNPHFSQQALSAYTKAVSPHTHTLQDSVEHVHQRVTFIAL